MVGMGNVDGLRVQLAEAAEAAEVLTAGWDIFAFIAEAAGRLAAESGELFPALMSVAVAAAEGRDAVGFAPSLPPGQHAADEEAPAEPDTLRALGAMSDILPALASQMRELAQPGAEAGDRQACRHAAGQADLVGELLAAVTAW